MRFLFHFQPVVSLSYIILLLIHPSPSYSKPSSDLILLDIDNTIYQDTEAGIETQIVKNTHSYCERHLGLSREQADDLYRAYGSTIEGLKQKLWKDVPKEKMQKELQQFYQEVYKHIDMSKLLPSKRLTGSSTGYSHNNKDRELLCRLLKYSPHPISVVSNSPSWHVKKVVQTMGLSHVPFLNNRELYTPDRLVFYPTKHTPEDFFAGSNKNLEEYENLLVFDDSKHNLQKIGQYFSNAKGIHISSEYSLATALMHAFGLVDPSFEFCQVQYLESKNQVDRKSIHKETWNKMIKQISGLRDETIRIVDLGTGVLFILDLLLHGDLENGLDALFSDPKKATPIHYTAYESNKALYNSCHDNLLSWGFSMVDKISDNEFIYEYRNIRVRFVLTDFDDRSDNEEYAPHLIVGCCFADLMDPLNLVPSLIHKFKLLKTSETILYFPITFVGTTQFLPPQPFESHDHSVVPSDTVAFRLYSKSLTETLGHNLDSKLFQEVLEEYGATLLAKGTSDWKIDSKAHSYLFDTMLYFFGTAGGPQILEEGLDAPGWINRAKRRRPNIQVSNVDFLFRIGKAKGVQTQCTDSLQSYNEILFTAPEKVRVVQKPTRELGPNEVLSKLFRHLSFYLNESIIRLTHFFAVKYVVESSYSLISSGTELKIFKGLFEDASLDVNIKGMEEERMAYPLAYGYSLVGRIVKCGSNVAKNYIGQLAFTFSPHASHVIAEIDSVQIVPDGVAPEDAIFMPSVETALSIVHDAHVRVGENVAVYGQGLIGLLVTSMLKMHSKSPISGKFGTITVFDTIPDRLAAAAEMGASQALMPGGYKGFFDVSIEVSGNPRALQSAIDHTSTGGRIIVGSWYGNTDVQLKLGIDFHRSHKKIQTSQVSEIPAGLLGLWNKQRRFGLTWELVQQIRPSRLLTKVTTLENAQIAYEALDRGEEIAIAFDFRT